MSDTLPKGFHYYQFYKPAGCVTALSDEKHITIVKYLQELDMTRIRPVGRLDLNTEGLLILTDDGIYNQRMTHPEAGIEKEYFFYALGEFTEEKQVMLQNGVGLGPEEQARPASIRVLETMTLSTLPEVFRGKLSERSLKNRPESPVFSGYITVTEGKKHEVKRILKSIGTYCLYLKRVRMGDITLFPDLLPGEYREMNQNGMEK